MSLTALSAEKCVLLENHHDERLDLIRGKSKSSAWNNKQSLRKLKWRWDRISGSKQLVELRLSESTEEIAKKLCDLAFELYKDDLVDCAIYIVDPLADELVGFRHGQAYCGERTGHAVPDVVYSWSANNNNSSDWHVQDYSELFKPVFASDLPDLQLSRRTSSSWISCCKRKRLGALKVLCWPIAEERCSPVALSFLLLKARSSCLQEALQKIGGQVLKAYKKIMAELSDKQKFVLLSDLGSIFTKNLGELSCRIISKLMNTLHAQSGTLLLVEKNNDEFYAQAVGGVQLEEEYRVELSCSGFMSLYSQAKAVSLTVQEGSQLAKDIENLMKFSHQAIAVRNLLVVPGFFEDGDHISALFCLFNKIGCPKGFTKLDEELMSMVVNNCRHIVCNALDWRQEILIKRQSESLLDISKKLFSHLDDVSELLYQIMIEARNLAKAERCSLFLVDEEARELVAKVFDGAETENELRIPISQGIAGHVATTGVALNIRDAYAHPLFYREVDNVTGFKTKHILCFPISDGDDKVIGVAQLCNKINGNCFTKFDEERTSAFAIFCGLSLVQSLLYKKATDAQQRSKLANELMLYHMRVPNEEIEKYTSKAIPTRYELSRDMDKFGFMPRIQLAEHDSIKVVLAMFHDLDLIRRWKIKEHTLVSFILTVRRGYRDPPYHNWTHAWTVAHFSYLLLKNTKARQYISDLEAFVLIVACLCHDIDHRGTNNSFQISSHSVLASLYSSAGSVLERHHFAQAMCIIQTDFCNIFESLSKVDYSRALDLMQIMILATDLASHFKISQCIGQLAQNGINKSNKRDRELLLSLFMTTSDLSDQTKPWESAIKVSDMLYEEFFAQGDQEKSLGYKPIEMMDRERASIPDLQAEFLTNIALPIYGLLATLFPESKCILTTIENNRSEWNQRSAQAKAAI